MQLSTILAFIDNGQIALPEFQRGYVWSRDQVRGLMQSLYRRYPVGGLLVWTTATDNAATRGDEAPAPGLVKLLLDGPATDHHTLWHHSRDSAALLRRQFAGLYRSVVQHRDR